MSAALEAGPALDAHVAEYVMGYPEIVPGESDPLVGYIDYVSHIGVRKERTRPEHYGIETFAPSTNIADAWQVVEKLRDTGGHPEIRWIMDWDRTPKWWANFGGHRLFDATAETAPLAICRAALLAVSARTDASPTTEVSPT